MQRYNPGATVPLRHTVKDADGTLTAATVALAVSVPDGTIEAPTVTSPSTGIYDAALPVTVEGPYDFTWTVSGTVDDVVEGSFYVGDSDDEDALPPLASVEHLGRKLGYTPEGSERDRASEVLDEASELIRDVAGETWVDDTGALTGVPRRVRLICLAAAFRAFGNPEALTQRSIGDSSKSYDRSQREGGEAVYLTKEEKAAVRKAAGTSSLVSVTLQGATTIGGYGSDPWEEVTAE